MKFAMTFILLLLILTLSNSISAEKKYNQESLKLFLSSCSDESKEKPMESENKKYKFSYTVSYENNAYILDTGDSSVPQINLDSNSKAMFISICPKSYNKYKNEIP